MKKLVTLMFGAAFWALPVWSDQLVISSSGHGLSENTAIAAAKRQVALDMQTAGLTQNGYRSTDTRVVEVLRGGSAFIAFVEADVLREAHVRRIVFVLAGEESQTPRLLAILRRLRSILSEELEGLQPVVEITEVSAEGALRIKSISDLQRRDVSEELAHAARKQQAEIVYVLTATSDSDPVYLLGSKTGGGSKTIRTLRDSASGGSQPISTQVNDAVRLDMNLNLHRSHMRNIITFPLKGKLMRKGESVVIYVDRANTDTINESAIITHGVITEVTNTTIRVVTDDPIIQGKGSKWRITLVPAPATKTQRGVIIQESDW